MTETPTRGPRVGLFATCLMNVFRPNVGFSAVKLLEDAGCTVEVPANQTCCGQPGYNSGDYDAARALARQVIVTFEQYDYIVGPSGSCMATIRHDYPVLFQDDPVWRDLERICQADGLGLALPPVRFPQHRPKAARRALARREDHVASVLDDVADPGRAVPCRVERSVVGRGETGDRQARLQRSLDLHVHPGADPAVRWYASGFCALSIHGITRQ